jgi:hypothetical protein
MARKLQRLDKDTSVILACGVSSSSCMTRGSSTPPQNLQLWISYNRDVRRSLAISLLLLFSLPLIAPMFALQADAGSNLPACCRRNGTHRCSMQIPGESQGVRLSVMREKCPAYPKAVTSTKRTDLSLETSTLLLSGALVHPAAETRVRACARMALYRSQQQRGPPAFRT